MTSDNSTSAKQPVSNSPQRVVLDVAAVELLPADVYKVTLNASAGNNDFSFYAGQYLELVLDPDTENETKVPYSIASAPGLDELELHVMNQGAGTLSQRVIQIFQQEKTVTAIVAMGECILKTSTLSADESVLLIAAGTCFGQMKAMLEHAVSEHAQQQIYLYWGVRDASQLYMSELAKTWSDEQKNIHFVPVVSEPNDVWEGRTGLVHHAVLEDIESLAMFQVYVCGSPPMVYAVEDEFIERGLKEGSLHSDVFAYAPRPVKA